MGSVTFSDRALVDLEAIGEYIAIDDPVRAKTFLADLFAACSDLADFPRAYRPAPRFGKTARRRVRGNYVIIYKVRGDDVTIMTVVHAARDIDALI